MVFVTATSRAVVSIGYCNADRGSNEEDRHSVSEVVFIACRRTNLLICWSMRKKSNVATSTCELNSDSEEDSATSTGGGSFSLGEQRNNSDEEEPGVTTPEPGAPHPSESVITNANPTSEYSVHHRTRKKAKAVPVQEQWTSQCSKKGIPPQYKASELR